MMVISYSRKPRRLGAWKRLALGALLMAAAPPTSATDRTFISEVMAIESALHQAETAQVHEPRLSILVAGNSTGLRLRTVQVQIDERPPSRYEFAQPEWEAIAMGAAHPSWQGTLAPGKHRLRLELSARELDPQPNDARRLEWIDETIEISQDTTLLVTLENKRFARDSLSIQPMNAAEAAQASARFWLWSERPFLAARVLARASTADDGALAGLKAQSQQQFVGVESAPGEQVLTPIVARYDDATRQLASGGTEALEALAKLDAEDEATWGVRDHANLMLGYHHLRQARAKEARAALGSVRSPGPLASEAMLGYGWTFLIEEAPAEPSGDERDRKQPDFVLAAEAATAAADPEQRENALRSALVPWTELIGVDPLDVAAQEGALAVAWVLQELETGAQAHTYFERSANRLEVGRRRLAEAMEHVGSGAAAERFAAGQNDEHSGWRAWLSHLPYEDDTAYMRQLLKDPEFVMALEDYRAARVLDDALLDSAERLQALAANGAVELALERRISSARQQHATWLQTSRMRMERLALNRLRSMKARLDQYLVHARFALARHYDSMEPADELALMESGS